METQGISGFFQGITEQITNTVGPYLPRLTGALLVLLIGWLIALIVSSIVRRVVGRTRIGNKIASWLGGQGTNYTPGIEKRAGKGAYYLIMLFVLVAFFQALGLTIITEPLNELISTVVNFIPRLIGAAILFFIARIIASGFSLIVWRGLDAFGLDTRLERHTEGTSLSKTLADVVYYFIFLLFLPAILHALALDGILAPIQEMIAGILNAIPAIFAAGVLLYIAFLVGRVIARLISSLLASFGFDTVLHRLGLKYSAEGNRAPSNIVGYIVLVAIMLFAATEASRLVGFASLGTIITTFTVFAGKVILGVVIMGLGLFLANVAASAILASGTTHAGRLATVTRIVILAFAGALALGQIGVAENVVNMAFGLTLGAVAVAAALAFGLGGREAAADALRRWNASLDTQSPDSEIPKI